MFDLRFKPSADLQRLRQLSSKESGRSCARAIVSDENRNKGRHLPNQHIRSTNRPAIDAIAAILTRGQSDGTIRSNVDPEHLWISILSLIMFYFTNAFTLSHLLNRDLLAGEMVVERKNQIKQLVLSSLRSWIA